MEIYTIGFTQRSAEGFFGTLKNAGIGRLVDVRLRTTSQLAGFAKGSDLVFFLRELAGIEYVYESLLTPTPELLRSYRRKQIPWLEYESSFRQLMEERRPEEQLAQSDFIARSVLLCSEANPEHCHRRLVAERLASKWGDLSIKHL